MLNTLHLILLILGLGIFIVPKQTMYAQNSITCADQSSKNMDCCKKEKTANCPSDNSKKKPVKDNCSGDCDQCHSCTVQFVMNYFSPTSTTLIAQHLFPQKSLFEYKNFYFSSISENIWQPPKIG